MSHTCNESTTRHDLVVWTTGLAGEAGVEHDDGLVFLYKLHKGAAPKSYGLQVCSPHLHAAP